MHFNNSKCSITKKMQAQLFMPMSVFVSNEEIFIAEMGNHRVRKVLRNGEIVTIAGTGVHGYNGDGQPATSAQLYGPNGVVVSSSNQVYISEMYGYRIRKIDQNGIISTIVGNGVGGSNGDDQLAVNTQVNQICGLFVTEDEEVLFADMCNQRVSKIDRNGIITTIVGTSQLGTNFVPTSVFQYRNDIFITDSGKGIKKISQLGTIKTIDTIVKDTSLIDDDEYDDNEFDDDDEYDDIDDGTKRSHLSPYFVFVFKDELYVANRCRHTVQKIHMYNGTMETLIGNEVGGCSGDGSLAKDALVHCPTSIFVDENAQVYIADFGCHKIRRIDRNGIVNTVVGTRQAGYSGDVPFDFEKYPHIGPKKNQLIKPFPKASYDITVHTVTH